MNDRILERLIPSIAVTDGAGVKLRRSLGSTPSQRLDPFLLLDEFFSDDPDDYIAGFPAHPHRGFETVTYMLDGHMRHEDNLGHRGDLGPGDVQWMTAGRGIIHSEIPQQSEGRLRGFQLWINLPAREKLKPGAYRDIAASEIPRVAFAAGEMSVIAGQIALDGVSTTGPIAGAATDPLYVDVRLLCNGRVDLPLAAGRNALVYVYEGELRVGAEAKSVPQRTVGVLGDGERLRVSAGPEGARFLLLAGKPLGEPVVQYGPFVMNSREEIEQALADYRDGRLTDAAA